MNDAQKEIENLLEQWKIERNYGDQMTWDGILDDEYWHSSPRILCLLKDSHDDFRCIAPAINGHGPKGSSPIFWKRLHSWIEVIRNQWNGVSVGSDTIARIQKDPVRSIGYVNIKKEIGKPKVSWSTIRSFAEADKDYLKRQIHLINPQVILCCGSNLSEGVSVFSILKDIIMKDEPFVDTLLLPEETFRIRHYGSWLAINWWHPSYPNKEKTDWRNLNKYLGRDEVQNCISQLKHNYGKE